MTLNVYGPLLAMQAVIPLMRKQGGGAIVNISSMLTKMAISGLSAYTATKSALNMLTLTARAELAADGITVSLVYPGLTATDFRQRAIQSKVQFQRPAFPMPAADPPEKVAAKILEAVETGVAEIALK
jgi:short-subunit dehydrogenase